MWINFRLSPNTVGHGSCPPSEPEVHAVRAELLPAVMAPPLVGQNQTGVPEEGKEGPSPTPGLSGFGLNPAPTVQAEHLPAVEGTERSSSPLDLSAPSTLQFSPAYSTGHSTLHGVPSIKSLEVFDEGEDWAVEETVEAKIDRLEYERKLWKTECRKMWQRQKTLENNVKYYEGAVEEAQAEVKQAKEEAAAAIRKAEEEAENKISELQRKYFGALTEADRAQRKQREAESEVARLQQRLTENLKKTAPRSPRKERSRSPLRTARARSPEVQPSASPIPEANTQVEEEPELSHPSFDVQAEQHDAPGPLRRMPKCRRRCCQPPPPANQPPRPPRRSREAEQLGPIIEPVVFDERPRRRSRQPPARLVVDMMRRSYASMRNSLMPQGLKGPMFRTRLLGYLCEQPILKTELRLQHLITSSGTNHPLLTTIPRLYIVQLISTRKSNAKSRKAQNKGGAP
ncbi:unnamed protein product [Bursaphelenchus xylophilus]|uniref:(pine wood nematode) hypothetical protein n=1 Tax=Bursaphelenchus xylophilus TaxID=6326 RepID=A0A811K725_BURXY|nr:unnamed protein product [Bursaphelenchus xylophilus]CAG9087159.1 unnamed protein product [Bursaphelenchus xylophilus]